MVSWLLLGALAGIVYRVLRAHISPYLNKRTQYVRVEYDKLSKSSREKNAASFSTTERTEYLPGWKAGGRGDELKISKHTITIRR